MNEPIDQPISVSVERLTPLFDLASAAEIYVGALLTSLELDPELATTSKSKNNFIGRLLPDSKQTGDFIR